VPFGGPKCRPCDAVGKADGLVLLMGVVSALALSESRSVALSDKEADTVSLSPLSVLADADVGCLSLSRSSSVREREANGVPVASVRASVLVEEPALDELRWREQ
jgi:hypothetical protein